MTRTCGAAPAQKVWHTYGQSLHCLQLFSWGCHQKFSDLGKNTSNHAGSQPARPVYAEHPLHPQEESRRITDTRTRPRAGRRCSRGELAADCAPDFPSLSSANPRSSPLYANKNITAYQPHPNRSHVNWRGWSGRRSGAPFFLTIILSKIITQLRAG